MTWMCVPRLGREKIDCDVGVVGCAPVSQPVRVKRLDAQVGGLADRRDEAADAAAKLADGAVLSDRALRK